MIDVVIETRGGVVAEIYCDRPIVRAIVIDWDELEDSGRGGTVGFDWSKCAPLDALPVDTRQQYIHAIAPRNQDKIAHP